MPCIRRRYHFGNVWLAPTVIENQSALCGQTVDIALPDGDAMRVHFLGFIDQSQITPDMQRVKLINIEAFNPVASVLGDWIEYGRNCFMLGAYRQHCVYLVLQDGLPVAWCGMLKPEVRKPPAANVVKIRPD